MVNALSCAIAPVCCSDSLGSVVEILAWKNSQRDACTLGNTQARYEFMSRKHLDKIVGRRSHLPHRNANLLLIQHDRGERPPLSMYLANRRVREMNR